MSRPPAEPGSRRARAADAGIAALVLLVELAATYGSLTGAPLDPVEGWTLTRPTDAVAFASVVVGCAALYWRRTRPAAALLVATAAYALFLLRDYELGLLLAPMVALYSVAALGRTRTGSSTAPGERRARYGTSPAGRPSAAALLAASLAGAAAVAVSLVWVRARTEAVSDPGVALLAWVAFGTVIVVFFVGSFVAGELVRCHRLLSPRTDPRVSTAPAPAR
ncbi:hypothetical protein DFP74_0682 [Nocardiopsis sp. Huas11]|uniref:DUF7134 domain-containing protein n=1 Tax=Nocardiopsis sp. Huas11 TaxID=2183912 RepID=UPI000EB1EC30|nr:hypothetical protein [Nocardiopsis sp. Huas11]RKS05091.1 hypothetical protein DFP74_0682 [Nocardiopsis sp. Huas11]